MWSSTCPHSRRQAGFTLIEMIIGMVIMAMIVTTLYYAFYTATNTWQKQDAKSDMAKRAVVVHSILEKDFSALRPYTFRWPKGENMFFVGGPQAVYYVTTHGFGAEKRASQGLYFACLFLLSDAQADEAEVVEAEDQELSDAEDSPDTYSLYLCKVDHPAMWLVQAMDEYTDLSESARGGYTPGEEMRERSIRLISGLQEPVFSFAGSKVKLDELEEQAQGLDSESEDPAEQMLPPLPSEQWTSPEDLPAALQFQALGEWGPFQVGVEPLLLEPYEEKKGSS